MATYEERIAALIAKRQKMPLAELVTWGDEMLAGVEGLDTAEGADDDDESPDDTVPGEDDDDDRDDEYA